MPELGGEVDFAQAIFVRPLRSVEPLHQLVHFLGGYVDEERDLLTQQALPCELAVDLSLERCGRGTDPGQVRVHLLGPLAEILGSDARICLIDFGLVDRDVRGLRRLNLKRFVDQVAQYLRADLLQFGTAQLLFVRSRQQGDPLVEVGPRNHLSVHDCRRLAHVGIGISKQGHLVGQVQLVDDRLRRLCLNGERCGGEAHSGSKADDVLKEVWLHAYRSNCDAPSGARIRGCGAGCRLNIS